MDGDAERATTRGEVIKFAVLIVVLLLVVLVVALTRPFIFNRVVPVVLGEPAAAPATLEEEGDTAVDPAYPASTPASDAETGGEIYLPSLGAEPSAAGATGGIEEGEAAETAVAPKTGAPETGAPETMAPEAADSAVATPTPRTHVVQPGETLTRLAQRYGVTVAAIVAANQIDDPNRIPVGMALRIPPP